MVVVSFPTAGMEVAGQGGFFQVSIDEVKEIFKGIDNDGDGNVDMEEFLVRGAGEREPDSVPPLEHSNAPNGR